MQIDLPAVETLSITDTALSIDLGFQRRSKFKLPKPVTPRRQRRQTAGSKQAYVFPKISEGSFSGLAREPQSQATSPRITEGSWTLRREAPDHSGLSDEPAMDLDDLPITQCENLFQRPLLSVSQMQSLTPKRKHREIFEVDGDTGDFVPETPSTSNFDYSFSTKITSISKRQSVKPDKLRTRIRPGPRLPDQNRADRNIGHDGPLLSKADFGNSSPKRPKSKFVSFSSFEGKDTMEANQSTSEDVRSASITTGISTQTPSKRPRVVSGRTACSSGLGAGKENQSVYNSHSSQEDFDTNQGPGRTKKLATSDMTDSIRTAYG